MKKFFAIILALVLALILGVTAFATEGGSADTFDPALEITTSEDGKTITVTMNDLPEGLSAELVIPCDGWTGAVVKDSSGNTVASTFGEVDMDPGEEITEMVKAVTFEASGGTYTITKVAVSSGGYYPSSSEKKPAETKPAETPTTTPAKTPDTTPVVEVTVPVSGDENTIHVEAAVSGTTATIDKVDLSKLDSVIGDHVETGTVTIDFSTLVSTEPIETVELPAEVVKEIAEAVASADNDAESFEIILSTGASIEFDAKALSEKASQAGGADITISIKQTEEKNLSSAQKTAVGDRVAFDINVTSGGVHISDMGGKVTIHAPYELREGEDADGIVVFYVDDLGNRERCKTSYDSVKKRVNWETNHLSVYMIDYEAPAIGDNIVDDVVEELPTEDIEQGRSSVSGAAIAIGGGALALVIILFILLRKKKV